MTVDISKRKKLGYLEGWISIVLNTSIFVAKYWAGRAILSVAMVADAWHTLADSITSVIVILGFWMAARPPDNKHHFGHGRAESIASVIIGTLLGVVGVGFFRESIARLVDHKAVQFSFLPVLIFLLSAVLKEGLAQFSFWASKKAESRSLKADGWHHRSDAIASAMIVLGALLGKKIWWMDGVLGIAVSLLILYSAFDIIRGASSYLIGESPQEALEERIKNAIRRACPALEEIHHLHIHFYGAHLEITAHLYLPKEMRVEEAHSLVTKAEAAVKEEIQSEVTIHIEPKEEE